LKISYTRACARVWLKKTAHEKCATIYRERFFAKCECNFIEHSKTHKTAACGKNKSARDSFNHWTRVYTCCVELLDKAISRCNKRCVIKLKKIDGEPQIRRYCWCSGVRLKASIIDKIRPIIYFYNSRI